MVRKYSVKQKTFGFRAQAIVEFAIVLPILLVILVGLFEVGRLIFIYSAATNASREAARYASAVGLDDNGLTRFNYCEGIKNVALSSAFLVPASDLTIEIEYDHGPGESPFAECNLWNSSQVDGDIEVSTGDRVLVTVTVQYRPMLKLVPITPRVFEFSSARTIFGIVNLDP